MNQLPSRRVIRLQNFDYTENGAYFVTLCTYNRVSLFGKIAGSNDPAVGAHLCVRPHRPDLMVTKWLKETEQKYPGIQIDSFIIMPDHIHLILFRSGAYTGAPLPEIIQWFKTQTTNEYIKCVKAGKYPSFDKHIWQRGYYEHVIRNDTDLYEIRKYISDNPARWLYRHTQNGQD